MDEKLVDMYYNDTAIAKSSDMPHQYTKEFMAILLVVLSERCTKNNETNRSYIEHLLFTSAHQSHLYQSIHKLYAKSISIYIFSKKLIAL
jgi:hypothetical protein